MLTLNDKFFYVSLAMLITALVAASQWDALSLDQRDAAILDPLPVPAGDRSAGEADGRRHAGRRRRAGRQRVPELIFPWMVSFSLRQMRRRDCSG